MRNFKSLSVNGLKIQYRVTDRATILYLNKSKQLVIPVHRLPSPQSHYLDLDFEIDTKFDVEEKIRSLIKQTRFLER